MIWRYGSIKLEKLNALFQAVGSINSFLNAFINIVFASAKEILSILSVQSFKNALELKYFLLKLNNLLSYSV